MKSITGSVLPLAPTGADGHKYHVLKEVTVVDTEERPFSKKTLSAKPARFDSDKENIEASARDLYDMEHLRVAELEHIIKVQQKQSQVKVQGLQEEIKRLESLIVTADSTEDATGDPATTVLLLRAKLSAAEEQRTGDKVTMQRLQNMLSSTQDNANLANSCLLKKVHAAQRATDTAQEALATSQQQYKTDMAAMYQLYNKQCATVEQQHSQDSTATNRCEDKMGAFGVEQPTVASSAAVAFAGMYESADAVHNPLYAYDPAGAVYDPEDPHISETHLQLVPVQPQHVQGSSNTVTPWHAAAQDSSSLTAQQVAQQQQHAHELATMHQQYVQQLALVQQEHLQQLAALELQQQQQSQQKKVGKWQQIFGTAPRDCPDLNPAGTSKLQVALMQQQHEVALTVSEAQQLKHAQQLHEVETRLVIANNQAAQTEQQLQQCQHSLSATEALHMQHILSMAEFEGQLTSEQEHSSAQSQQLQQLQKQLAAADSQSLQDCKAIAGLNMQLTDAATSAQEQEAQLQQWQSWGADAESLQAQTSSKVTMLEEQLASAQQLCADQQAQLITLKSQLADANQTALSVAALEGQLSSADQLCADQQAQLATLQRQLADTKQSAFNVTVLVQQLAGAQQVCADQAEQLQQLQKELDANRANMVSSIVALERQMTEVGKTAQAQQDLLIKSQAQNETLQQQLTESVTSSQAKQAEAQQTISDLHQTVSELKEASQQQISMLETQTAEQLKLAKTEAEQQLATVKQEAKQQLTVLQQLCDNQKCQHSLQIKTLQDQLQVVSSTNPLLSVPDHPPSTAVQHSSGLQLLKQKLQQTVQAGKAKQAAKDVATADLQHQLLATRLQVSSLQKQLAEQTQAAAAYKASLELSWGHVTKLQLVTSEAHAAYDMLRAAYTTQDQLYQKALEAASQLRSELQSRKKRVQQLQASKDEMVSIADGYRGIVTRLEPAANQGRMMAALLEMLLTRTKIPADQMGSATPIQQLEVVIEELEVLRAQVYPDVYPLSTDDPTDDEADWDI